MADTAEKFVVHKGELDQLYHEVKQIKRGLPKFLSKDVSSIQKALLNAGEEKQALNDENKSLKREMEILKKHHDVSLNELEREKKGNSLLRQQVSELTDVTNKQAEYCAKLGSTTCALLWNALQQDNCLPSVLKGEHGNDFILLASHTLESYSAAAQENIIDSSDSSGDHEHQYVVRLVGVITNISASAYGREFLMTSEHGKDLLSVMISMVADLQSKSTKLFKLKNLVLKTLHNVSINQKGIKFLCSKKEMFSNLSQVVDENCASNRLLALKLIQFIIVEPDCAEIVHVVLELFSIERLESFASGNTGELQNVCRELIKYLHVLK